MDSNEVRVSRERVATTADVPEGEVRVVECGERSLALSNIDGEFYAIDNICTHDGGPLGEGTLRRGRIICPRHGAAFDAKTGKVLSLPETLDQIIERNVQWLTRWQNAAYAGRYRNAVETIRKTETGLPENGRAEQAFAGPLPLTRAVAHNLAKLMAYKDEYEVARLYSDPVFLDRLRASFEGEPGRDYTLQFHMAPPRLAKRDEQGRPKKRAYGPWMLSAMKVLARFRRLRGTALDPFGHTDERKRERRLIEDYLSMLDEFTRTLAPEKLPAAIELARLPEEIRGYGYVKEAAMDKADQRRAALMHQYRNGAEQEIRRKAVA